MWGIEMIESYRKKLISGLLVLLLIFGIVFFISFWNLQRGRPTFGFGFNSGAENWIIILLCFGSIIKVLYEIIKVEHIIVE